MTAAGTLMACHDCDLLHRIPPVPEGGAARCCRCGAVLLRNKPNSFERALALTIASLVLFALSNAFPFLGFKMQGLYHETRLVSGLIQLYDQGMLGLTFLVTLTTLVAPGIHLAGLIYVLAPLRFNRTPPGVFQVYRLLKDLQPWGMLEVFMLGILVSIVKLGKMATIVPGISVFSFGALIFTLAAAMNSLDPHDVWDRWEGER